MAAADARYRFTFVDVGSYGKQSDSNVFANCSLAQCLSTNSLDIPSCKPLPGTQEPLPIVFVADEPFPLNDNLMRPFPGQQLIPEKRIFNYRLSRARRTVENALGIMSSRFGVFRRAMAVTPSTADEVVKACTVLHNMLRNHSAYCDDTIGDHEDEHRTLHDGTWRHEESAAAFAPLHRSGRFHARRAVETGERFTAYFSSSSGSVPWKQNLFL